MHVKCATIIYWQMVLAFVHASTIVPSNNGQMDKAKVEYTWTKFMRECNRRFLT